MKTIELFCGTKSFSKVAGKRKHMTYTIDNNGAFEPDLCADILKVPIEDFAWGKYDLLWASPPCIAFSVASISKNWKGDRNKRTPKSASARHGLRLLDKTIEWIARVKPKEWFIENPRGMMRKVIDDLFRKHGVTGYRRLTVTYCQYGDTRQKPTDIWTNNMTWRPKPACKKGAKCHQAAPRGSKTGTQGLKNATERGMIPAALFEEIFKHREGKHVKDVYSQQMLLR